MSTSPTLNADQEPDTSGSFPRQNRLLAAADYNSVFRKGERIKLKCFIGQVARNSLSRARLGLAVSKKSCRKASDRNRIKRLVREYFRQNKGDWGSRDFIVLVTPTAATSSSKKLREELSSLFEKMCERTLRSYPIANQELTTTKLTNG